MIAAARSGASAGYFTAVGADRFGQSLVELWRAEGVDASRVIVNGAAHTGIYFVTHGAEGHEFSYLRAGSAASRMTEADVPADYIGAARALHVSEISQAISSSAADAVFAAIEIARRQKVMISYDTNLRLKLWPLKRAIAIIHEAMKSVDIALPGLDDARRLTGLEQPDAIVDFYLRLGAGVVALTLGKDGALTATPRRRERVASFPVDAVDADRRRRRLRRRLSRRIPEDRRPFQATRFANVAAALSTCGYGAVAPLPSRAQTLAGLAKT